MRPSMYANADCSRRSSAVQSPKSGGASITRMSKPMRRLTDLLSGAMRRGAPNRVRSNDGMDSSRSFLAASSCQAESLGGVSESNVRSPR